MARHRGAHGQSDLRQLSSYWERTHWPLQTLYFLLPLIIVYEVGVVLYAGTQDISARRLLRLFFEWAGVTGYYLPGLMVIIVLLCWHLVRRDPWRPEPQLHLLMAVESIVLAVPLFVFMLVLFRQPAMPSSPELIEQMNHVPGMLAAMADGVHPHAAGHVPGGTDAGVWLANGTTERVNHIPNWKAGIVFSIGAGIYEELLFRLVAIALLHLLLVDILALPEHYGAVGAVAISAVAFAMYHFSEANPFDWGKFFFYTAAGVYFAAIYLLRGFGIAAGAHAVYDVLLVVTMQLQGD